MECEQSRRKERKGESKSKEGGKRGGGGGQAREGRIRKEMLTIERVRGQKEDRRRRE